MTSMWAFMTSWFTPASFFILLNLTIFTIFLTYRLGSQRKPQQQHPQLDRAPYFFDRIRSINFSHKNFEQPNADPVTEFFQHTGPEHVDPSNPNPNPYHPTPQLARSPSLLDRLKSINLSSIYRSGSFNRESEVPHPTEPVPETPNLNADTDHLVKRSKSDKGVGAPKMPVEKIKKSASEKLDLGRSERKETTSLGDDEEVDAKADDFINRFKQQLRLQRLDSLLRYREFLKGN